MARAADHRDRHEIFYRVIRQARIEEFCDHMGAGGGITDRVAVRRRTRQIYGCERSADGGSIFDHELLTQPLCKARKLLKLSSHNEF
jgi:hypothetical protein